MTETENYLALSSTYTDQEIFQSAISTLAQFIAFSIEIFHKVAELLLIKERRNTVNEADALVQLTNVLSDQINSLTSSFCNTLNQFIEISENPDNINANITTISLEVSIHYYNSGSIFCRLFKKFLIPFFFFYRLLTQIHTFMMPSNF